MVEANTHAALNMDAMRRRNPKIEGGFEAQGPAQITETPGGGLMIEWRIPARVAGAADAD